MPSTYTPSGTQAKTAIKYGSEGRNILDRDFINSNNLLDARVAPAYQTKLQSDYLNDITQSDSPYMQNVRLNALEGAASRGQFNSSIGVGAASRQALDAAAAIAQGDAQIGMANTAASNLRANKEYDAFSSLNRASFDDKNEMLTDSIDAANLFNQNDMAAMIAKGSAYDTQQYGKENKSIDQKNALINKAQDQKNALINKAQDQTNLLDKMGVEQGYSLDTLGVEQGYSLDTLAQEQKYDYQDRADTWKYDAEDLALRQKYQLEQDRATHADTLEADAKKYAHEGFLESLRQFGSIEQQFLASYGQIQSTDIPNAQKESHLRLLFNQKESTLEAVSSYSSIGNGNTYTSKAASYDTSGTTAAIGDNETVASRDFNDIKTQLTDIYSNVRLGGGVDSEEETLINTWQEAVTGLPIAGIREVTAIYNNYGLTETSWKDTTQKMISAANQYKQDTVTDVETERKDADAANWAEMLS